MYSLRFFITGEELCIADCKSNHFPKSNEKIYLTDKVVFDKKDIGNYIVLSTTTIFDEYDTSIEVILVKVVL